MACFIVPTIIGIGAHSQKGRFPKHSHPEWLVAMILGGSAALAIEHFAHGEIVPWAPFLTAMATPAATAAMLGEMAAIGIPMTLALIAAWAILVLAYNGVPALGKAKDAAVAPAE
ncbi:MAG: hypothetical protein WCT52_00510 [Candidatus Micrarchaeia archaeon]